jgi:hypothetical protein
VGAYATKKEEKKRIAQGQTYPWLMRSERIFQYLVHMLDCNNEGEISNKLHTFRYNEEKITARRWKQTDVKTKREFIK